MFKLLKQTFKTYFKKPGFLFTVGISFFSITFISSAAITLMSSLTRSTNTLNSSGTAATLVIDNIQNIENTLLIPDFQQSTDQKQPYQVKRAKTVAINMNAIDVDVDQHNLNSKIEKINFLRIFPYKRSDLVSHDIKKNFAKDETNPEEYANYDAQLICLVGNPLLPLGKLSKEKAKYGTSVSFYDPNNSKLLADPRHILFSYDPQSNLPMVLGYWNNGSIQNKVDVNASFVAYDNNDSQADSIFQNPEFSTRAMNRVHPNTILSNKYNFINDQGKLEQLAINDFDLILSVNIGNPHFELINNMTPYSTSLDSYFNSMKILNTKPSDPYEPYLEIVNGYSFGFSFASNYSPLDIKFKEYLMSTDPQNMLLRPLVLDEFNLLGMTLAQYNALSEVQKNEQNQKIESSIRQYGNLLSTKWNEAKKRWVYNELTTWLSTREQTNWSTQEEHYYQSEKNQHEFLYVPKDASNVNKVVIHQGVDLPHTESNATINDIVPDAKKTLTVQQFIGFLNHISEYQFSSKKETQKFQNLTKKCINDIEKLNNPSLSKINKLTSWKQWMLSYGEELKQDVRDPFNIAFACQLDAGFTTLWTLTTIRANSIQSNFVVISHSYFEQNNKKTLPVDKDIWISSGSSGNGDDQFPIYTMENILNGNVDEKYLNVNKFDQYLAKIPSEYKISFFDKEFLICGSGISPEYNYPIVSIQSPIPNPQKQGIVYVTKSLYQAILKYTNRPFEIPNIVMNSNDDSILINEIQSKSNILFGSDKLLNIIPPNEATNLSSLRYTIPQSILTILVVGSIFICLLLFLILLYSSYMMVNIVIDKLNSIIAICRAQGFSNTRIAFNIALPLVILVGILGGLAYLLTFALSFVFLGALGNIWFLPLSNTNFGWYTLMGSILIPMGIMSLVVFSLVYIKYRKPILDNLNDIDNVKTNFFSRLFRSVNNNSLVIWKYRGSLFLSRFWKLFILMILGTTTFGLGIASYTANLNAKNAIVLNNNTKQYTYGIDLVSPKENTGLYKSLPYSRIGITNPELGFNVSSAYLTKNDPYGKLMNIEYFSQIQQKWVPANKLQNNEVATDVRVDPGELFALRDNNGNPIDYDPNKSGVQMKYYTNLILPSFNTYNLLQNSTPNLLFDSTLSAFLLDISVSSLGNIWENIVIPLIPQKIAYQISSNLKKFKYLIFQEYPEFKKFIKNANSPNFDPNNIQLNPSKVIISSLDVDRIRYNDTYLKFLGKIFANQKIVDNDVRLINSAVVPINPWQENSSWFEETYSWLASSYIISNGKKYSDSIKIIGIKNNSQFVELSDEKGEIINIDKLGPEGIVINVGAALKYGLKIGDEIEINVDNDYFESSQKIAKAINPSIEFHNQLKLKIEAISNDPIGTSFYSSQHNVNHWTHMDKGDIISAIYSNRYTPYIKSMVKTISLKEYQQHSPDYVPFNGIFTNKELPLIGDKAILMMSNSGFYSSFFKFSDANPTAYFDPVIFASLYASRNSSEIFKVLNVNNYEEMKELILTNYSTSPLVKEWLSNAYNNIQLVTNITNVDSTELNNQLFTVTNDLIDVTNTILLVIFVPILIATIIICIVGIIDLTKKQIGILRLLGYTSPKITRTIIYIFLPILLASGAFGIGLLLGIMYLIKTQVFSLTSIYISSALNWWILLVGLGILLLLILFVSVVSYIFLKRRKYSELIKSSYN